MCELSPLALISPCNCTSLYRSALCRFYTECLGMKLLRQRDIPEEKCANAFLGYGPEESNFTAELTYSNSSH